MKQSTTVLTFFVACLLALFGTVKSNIILHCKDTEHCGKCQVILRDCYLMESNDIPACVSRGEKEYNIFPCLGQSPSFLSTATEIEAFTETENEDYSNEHIHHSLIEEIVEQTHKKIIIGSEEHLKLTESFKKKLIKLCNFTNFQDHFTTARMHRQATPEEIDEHIKETIRIFADAPDNMIHIKNSLLNPAICLKNPSEWVNDRAGYIDFNVPSVGILHPRNIPQFSKKINLRSPRNVQSVGSVTSSNCNRNNCNRFDDPNECEYNVRRLNQKGCGNCWAFATQVVFGALRCRRNLGYAEFSLKYMTQCKAHYFRMSPNNQLCSDGGHLASVLEVAERTKFLPSAHDFPYSEPINVDQCVSPQPGWTNLWEGVTLEHKIINRQSYTGFLNLSFQEYAKANNINELIIILKDYIIELGAVFVTMRTANEFEYNHDGAKVAMKCVHGPPTHGVTIIGFGEYTKDNGERSSYWLIRNSWGVNWGDNGNFKIDMFGPPGCNGNVLSSAFPLLLANAGKKLSLQIPNDDSSLDTIDQNGKITRRDSSSTPQSNPIPNPTPTPTPTPSRPIDNRFSPIPNRPQRIPINPINPRIPKETGPAFVPKQRNPACPFNKPATPNRAPVVPSYPFNKPAMPNPNRAPLVPSCPFNKPATPNRAPVVPLRPFNKPAMPNPNRAPVVPSYPFNKPAMPNPNRAPVVPLRPFNKPATPNRAPVVPLRPYNKPAIPNRAPAAVPLRPFNKPAIPNRAPAAVPLRPFNKPAIPNPNRVPSAVPSCPFKKTTVQTSKYSTRRSTTISRRAINRRGRQALLEIS